MGLVPRLAESVCFFVVFNFTNGHRLMKYAKLNPLRNIRRYHKLASNTFYHRSRRTSDERLTDAPLEIQPSLQLHNVRLQKVSLISG